MNNACKDEKVQTCPVRTSGSSGFIIVVVLYILLVVILNSVRNC